MVNLVLERWVKRGEIITHTVQGHICFILLNVSRTLIMGQIRPRHTTCYKGCILPISASAVKHAWVSGPHWFVLTKVQSTHHTSISPLPTCWGGLQCIRSGLDMSEWRRHTACQHISHEACLGWWTLLVHSHKKISQHITWSPVPAYLRFTKTLMKRESA